MSNDYKAALDLLQGLCIQRSTLTGDDWRDAVDRSGLELSPKATGALWLRASRFGWLIATGQTITSRHRETYGRRISIYESLLRQGPLLAESTTAS